MSVEQWLEKLERAIRRWRLLGIATSGLLVVVVYLGAAGPDTKGGELVLDKLVIRDSQGRERVVLGTEPDGTAFIQHLDANGKGWITAGTSPDGRAEVTQHDGNGKQRITATTCPDGTAGVSHLDGNEKLRIVVATQPDGEAIIKHVDVETFN